MNNWSRQFFQKVVHGTLQNFMNVTVINSYTIWSINANESEQVRKHNRREFLRILALQLAMETWSCDSRRLSGLNYGLYTCSSRKIYWFAKTKSIKKTSYCEKYLSNAEIQDCQVRTATEAANFVPVCQEAVCGQHSFCVHHPWSTVDDELMFWNMVMWIQNKVKNGFSDYTVMTNIVMIFLSVANLTIPWPF